jgi:hypothetical protein
MNIVIFSLFCLSCLAALGSAVQMRKHVKANHPNIWATFRYPNGSLAGSEAEGKWLKAERRFIGFLSSQACADLKDQRLSVLMSRYSQFGFLSLVLFLALAGNFLFLLGSAP